MNIEIQSDEPEETKKALSRPIEFNSRGQRTRLLVLVVMLMLVLIGMKEAGKAKNWRWMGFGADGKQLKHSEEEADEKKVEADEKKIVFRESQYDSASDSQKSEALKIGPQTSEAESGQATGQTTVEGFENVLVSQWLGEQSRAGEIYQAEFWELFYDQNSIGERRLLFSILRDLRNGHKNGAAGSKECGKLVQKMDKFVRAHSQELLGKISLLESDSPRRLKLDEQLQGFQKQWDSLSVVLNADQLPDESQLADVFALQSGLDVAAFNDVADHTRSGRPADDPAWLRVWETLFDPAIAPKHFKSVTPFQLRAQPDVYRGMPVALEGELRGIEVIRTRNNPLGIDPFYSVWIKHEESNRQPFNVYVTDLPEGIELENDYGQTLFKEKNISVNGVFFKVRTYADAGETISETPIVLCKSFQLMRKPPVKSVSVRSDFKISRGQWITFLVAMPLLAGFLAYYAYRGTARRRSAPGKVVTGQINDSLDQLSDDPEVKTVEEKLSSLNWDDV